MTYSIQPLSRTVIENAEKPKEPEIEEVTCDVIAVCDSLNKLCEVLSRLDYLIKRKKMEIILAQKRQDNSAEKI